MFYRSRQPALIISTVLLVNSVITIAEAQHTRPRVVGKSAQNRRDQSSGINTERIPAKYQQRWNTIKQIVFSKDSNGEFLHPVLWELWDRLDKSGHAVYIEMPDNNRGLSCMAGSFRIEKLDPSGSRHVGVILINLNNIDAAYVGPEATRSNGLVPFDGLSKEQRYAEVLGHELAHATLILQDLALAKKVEHLIEQTNTLLLSNHTKYQYYGLRPEMRQRLFERDQLLAELEEQAEEVELLIWQELVRGKLIKEGPR